MQPPPFSDSFKTYHSPASQDEVQFHNFSPRLQLSLQPQFQSYHNIQISPTLVYTADRTRESSFARPRAKPSVRQTVTNRPLRCGREANPGGHLANNGYKESVSRPNQAKGRRECLVGRSGQGDVFEQKTITICPQGSRKKEAQSGDKKQLEMAQRSVQI